MASSDPIAPSPDSWKPGILRVAVHGLSLPVDCEGVGLGNLANEDVRKELLPYVIVKHGNYQASVKGVYGRLGIKGERVNWMSQNQKWLGFNVSAPSDLTVCIIVKKNNSSDISQLIPIGFAKLNVFAEPLLSHPQSVDLQNGCGRILLKLWYTEKDLPPLEDRWEWSWPYLHIGSTDLLRVERKDISQHYAMKVVENSDTAAKFEIAHPFIAPLELSFRAPDKLSLLSPMASCGYLFSHLQKKRQFDAKPSRLCAAELVCVLECLHDHGIIFSCLRPEDILVNTFGHISICRPDLFTLDPQKKGHILTGTPEIAAPEFYLGQRPSMVMDWWSLGIFLYEMLTGLLPFYHNDPEKQRHSIINQNLAIERLASSDAAGILTRLLEKDPTKRLGVNGAPEVKAHAFFKDIDWDELPQRTCVACFEPCNTNMEFRRLGVSGERGKTRMQRRVSGIIYREDNFDEFRWWRPKGLVRNVTSSNTTESIVAEQKGDGTEIEWDAVSGEFYFHNRTTGEMRQVNEQAAYREFVIQEPQQPPPTAENHPAATDEVPGATKCAVPSERQKMFALADALKSGYGNRVIQRILEYSINLNVGILEYNYAGDYATMPDKIDGIAVSGYVEDNVLLTPLEWAVEHGNIDLVNLFLDKGADASYTIEVRWGPSLVKAVRKGDRRLLDILARRTDRISSTRALRLAVELRDTSMAEMLLSAGACCDFKRADGAGPEPASYFCCFGPGAGELQTWNFINPLAVAARAGDVSLVRLLLAHGADANADYHTLSNWEDEHNDRVDIIPVHFHCGRPVQAAMACGHPDVVRVLIEEGGADIWVPHPVSRFPGHACAVVSREAYIRVTAELEEVAAAVLLSQRASLESLVAGMDK